MPPPLADDVSIREVVRAAQHARAQVFLRARQVLADQEETFGRSKELLAGTHHGRTIVEI